jgi:2-dehydro-3-deoxygluconokinase
MYPNFDIAVVTEAALVDFIYEQVAAQFVISKGLEEWQMVERPYQIAVQKELKELGKNYKKVSGGQLTNTLFNLAYWANKTEQKLKTAIACSTGKDALGLAYANDLLQQKIDITEVQFGNDYTGKCLSIPTKNAPISKAMLTSLSPLKTLSDMTEARFKQLCANTRYVLFEGYFFNSEPKRIVDFLKITKEVKTTQNPNLVVGLTLSSKWIAHKMDLNFIRQYTDFIAANDEEFEALTNESTFEGVLRKVQGNVPKTLVYTMGSKGAIIYHNNKKQMVLPDLLPANQVVDVTGAGDGFLSGVLYGLLTNKSLQETSDIAKNLATKIIQMQGARLT